MKNTQFILSALAIATSTTVNAASSFEDKLSFNGFGTLGLTFMEGDSRDFGTNSSIEKGIGLYEDTKIGGQVSYNISDKYTITAQGRVKGHNNEFKPELTWAYLNYDINPYASLRAGRLSLPAFLISDSLDIGYAHTTVRPANEMYGQVPITSFEGMEFSTDLYISDNELKIQLFGGMVTEKDIIFSGRESKAKGNNLYGINTTLQLDYGQVRAGHVSLETDLKTDLGVSFKDADTSYTSLGYSFEYNNWLTSAEWGRVKIDLDRGEATTTGFYLTNGYRINDVVPYLTYARGRNSSFSGKQESIMVGARWDFTDSIALKGEYQHTATDNYFGAFELSNSLDYAGPLMGNPQEGEIDVISISLDFVF